MRIVLTRFRFASTHENSRDHAQLFFMSSLLWTIDPRGQNLQAGSIMSAEGRAKINHYFPDWDKHGAQATLYRVGATNIYKTKDQRYFHIHGTFATEHLSMLSLNKIS